MAETDPTTAAATAAAKELVKVAYGDLIQPSTKVVGAELEDFVRAIIIAGRGFGYIIRDIYRPFVLKALAKIPNGQRISPPPQLLGRILEGVSYEPPETPIYEMFEALLTRAMDRDAASVAHPAFPAFIQQLSPDEVRLVRHLWNNKVYGFESTTNNPSWDVRSVDRVDFNSDVIQLSENLIIYIDHLVSMGLVRLNHIESKLSDGRAGEDERFIEITLSELGRLFADATHRKT